MSAWVNRNCKFAMARTAGILDIISKQEIATMTANPSAIYQTLVNAYKKRMSLGGDFAQISPADVGADLSAVSAWMKPGQSSLNTPANVQTILKSIGWKPPQPPIEKTPFPNLPGGRQRYMNELQDLPDMTD
jgi:hypothetical protein